MTLFDGHRALWMWEFSRQAEKTLADACQTALNDAGADILLVKLMDGSDWMRRYDPNGYASLAQFQADAAAVAAMGVTAVPWVVPHGADPQAEAAAHAQLGPALICDVEPYTGFWTGPAANLPVYLQALRAGGVRELHISIDPRPQAIAALGGAGGFAGLVDGIHPQVYWTDFQTPALSVIAMIRSLLSAAAGEEQATTSGPQVYPVLPGNGSAEDLADVWTLARGAGCTGLSAWRLGSMDLGQLNNVKRLDFPAAPTPLEQRVANLEAGADAVLATLSRLNEVLLKRFEAIRAALDPASPPA
jgi:hypothetical protein